MYAFKLKNLHAQSLFVNFPEVNFGINNVVLCDIYFMIAFSCANFQAEKPLGLTLVFLLLSTFFVINNSVNDFISCHYSTEFWILIRDLPIAQLYKLLKRWEELTVDINEVYNLSIGKDYWSLFIMIISL